VERDPESRGELRALLEQVGARVLEAADGAAARALLGSGPDLVLLDADSAGAPGRRLCEGLRDRTATWVVALAGEPGGEPADALLRAGARDLWARPLDPPLLRQRLRCLLRQQREASELAAARDRLAEAVRLAGVGSFELDLGSGQLECSQELLAILGESGAGALDREAVLARVSLAERARILEAWREALAQGTPLRVRHRVRWPDGSSREVESRARLALDEEGEPRFLRGTCIELTASGAAPEEPAARTREPVGRPVPREPAGLAPPPRSRKLLESRLRGALERGELRLHYQPRVDADSREIVGLEALVRWTDLELGPVSPVEFIPLAEEGDLIAPLGLWSIRAACQQMVAWRDAEIAPERVSVNVSPRQFQGAGFAEAILREIEATGLGPERIELEITEGCLLDHESAVATLAALRAHGVKIAVDDFGTGYSSLQYLRRLPIDALKIDRSFIRDLEGDEAARSLAVSIISLAWSLGLRVVAEGVENEAQWAFLRDHGCDEIQGFLFSRPLAPPECGVLLRREARRGPPV